VKKFFVALALIPIIIWGIWLAIPVSFLQDRIEGAIDDRNFSIGTEGLEKTLFYKVTIERLTLNGYGKEHVSIEDIQAPIKFLSLIRFQLNVSFDGDIGGGTISGDIIRTMNKKTIEMTFNNAHINDLSFLQHAGIEGTGTLSGSLSMTRGTGHVEFVTRDAQFQPVVLSDSIVPLNFFRSVRGALDIKNDVIYISSIALEGNDIYARLKGKIDNTFINLSMEIMPGKSLLDNQLFTGALEKYRVSPGYYVIPIKRDTRSLTSS
jgi:type II secretion system protein N